MAGSLNVPHKISLPDTVHAGSVMRIRGSVPENASRFHVNLLLSEGQDSDAALHFNPRMDEAVVVLNSKAVVGDAVYHHFRHRLPTANVRLLEVARDL